MKLDYRYFFLLSFLFLQSCATLNESAAARIGIQYATGKVINGDSDRAQRVVDIATEVRNLASGDDQATVTLLIEATEALIDWDSLDQPDQQLARQLLAEIERELRARVGDGLLPEESRVTVVLVADWVIEAAQWSV